MYVAQLGFDKTDYKIQSAHKIYHSYVKNKNMKKPREFTEIHKKHSLENYPCSLVESITVTCIHHEPNKTDPFLSKD